MRAPAELIFAAIAVAAGGCDGFDPGDFADVCDGKRVAKAPAPDGEARPIFVALRRVGSPAWRTYDAARARAAGLAVPDAATYRRDALVVCVEQQPGPPARACTYDGIDVVLRDARYVVSVRRARDAAVIAARTVDEHAADCPATEMVSYVEAKPERFVGLSDKDLAAVVAAARSPDGK